MESNIEYGITLDVRISMIFSMDSSMEYVLNVWIHV